MTDKEFFKVTSLGTVLGLIRTFPCVSEEALPLDQCADRILSQDIASQIDLPEFNRATMDGYAVQARSTFGAWRAYRPFLQSLVLTIWERFPRFR